MGGPGSGPRAGKTMHELARQQVAKKVNNDNALKRVVKGKKTYGKQPKMTFTYDTNKSTFGKPAKKPSAY